MTGRGGSVLGPGREFDLIRSLLEPEEVPPQGVRLAAGDDCAVLEGGMVLSADLAVEGVHFRRDWVSMEEAGYRATAGALSDLAAMAAEPVGVLLSLGVAGEEAWEVVPALQEGARNACRREGASIIGGDVSRSPGPVFMDVIVLGRTDDPLFRKGSREGDEIWVTGWLGGAGAALHLLARGRAPSNSLRERFARPRARIREMRWLRDRATLRAGIDLSDGLAGDAGHLAASSGLAMILEAEALPLDPGMEPAFSDQDKRLHFGLRGGEDYEVCFSAPPGEVQRLVGAFRENFGIPLSRVGWVEAGGGVHLQGADGSRQSLHGGFDHFSEKENG